MLYNLNTKRFQLSAFLKFRISNFPQSALLKTSNKQLFSVLQFTYYQQKRTNEHLFIHVAHRFNIP
jgi:hypothetical protein